MKTNTKIEIGILALAALISLVFQIQIRMDTNLAQTQLIDLVGSLESEEFEIVSFTELRCQSDLKVEYYSGDPKVVIESDSEIIGSYSVKVSDGLLDIRSNDRDKKPSNSLKQASIIKIYNNTPLESLKTENNTHLNIVDGIIADRAAIYTRGNSYVSADSLNLEYLWVDLDGNSNVDLNGSLEELKVSSSGNSRFNLENLIANKLTVEASGNSNGDAKANETVEVQASGNSYVQIFGKPEKSRSTSNGNSHVNFE